MTSHFHDRLVTFVKRKSIVAEQVCLKRPQSEPQRSTAMVKQLDARMFLVSANSFQGLVFKKHCSSVP